MEQTFNFTRGDERWIFVIEDNTVQVYCNGQRRDYEIYGDITKVEKDGEYVYIWVDRLNNNRYIDSYFYQFKFEENQFLVGDLYSHDGTFVEGIAHHFFGDVDILN